MELLKRLVILLRIGELIPSPQSFIMVKGETEETFRMDSYLTNYGVKSTLHYIGSRDYKSQLDLQKWADETRAARRSARGN